MHRPSTLIARWLMLLISLWAICAARAADPAAPAAPRTGTVKHVSGTVTVQPGAQPAVRALVLGQVVEVGDVVRTAADGFAAITLADDTALTVGPNSELVITEFAFDATRQEGGLLVSLWRGTLAVISGLIAKKSPDAMKVQTRTVVLGVRGTEFIVDAGEGRR